MSGDGIPRTIGRYEITRLLGRGGMGVVYQARDPESGRDVAVKVMIAGEHGSPELIRRFQREARAVEGLEHPRIARVLEVGAMNGLNFIAMEYIRGLPLAELLKEGPLPVERALLIALETARALEAAHGKGIIHRDIKPSNLIIDEEGQPHIVDFGLAKSIEEDESLTASGDILGTPRYMSPEQAFGTQDEVDARSDLYSLGAVLFEMVTGRPTFDAPSTLAVLRKIEEEEPRPTGHESVDAIVSRCLEKNRDRRYANAAELAGTIQKVIEGGRLRHRPRRRRRLYYALGGVGLILLFLLVAVAGRVESARDQTLIRVRDRIARHNGTMESVQALSRDLVDLERHLAKHSRDDEARLWRARARTVLWDLRGAMLDYERVLDRRPGQEAVRLEFERVRFLRQDLLQNAVVFEALHNRPSSDWAGILKAAGTATDSHSRIVRATAHVHLADKSEDPEPQAEKAEAEVDAVLAAEPRHAAALFLKALIRARLDDPIEAFQLLGVLQNGISQDAPEASLIQAVIIPWIGEEDTAMESVERAMERDPEDPFALCLRFALEWSLVPDEPQTMRALAEETLAELTPLIESAPELPAPSALCGRAQVVLDRNDEGRKTFTRAAARFGFEESWEWHDGVEGMVEAAGLQPAVLFECAAAEFLADVDPARGVRRIEALHDRLAADDAFETLGIPEDEGIWIRARLNHRLAIFHLDEDRHEEALEHLERAVEEGFPLEEIEQDEIWDSVRGMERFRKLVDDE